MQGSKQQRSSLDLEVGAHDLGARLHRWDFSSFAGSCSALEETKVGRAVSPYSVRV